MTLNMCMHYAGLLRRSEQEAVHALHLIVVVITMV